MINVNRGGKRALGAGRLPQLVNGRQNIRTSISHSKLPSLILLTARIAAKLTVMQAHELISEWHYCDVQDSAPVNRLGLSATGITITSEIVQSGGTARPNNSHKCSLTGIYTGCYMAGGANSASADVTHGSSVASHCMHVSD